MSKKSNPTVIGAFVLGAIVLLAIGVAIFGGAELLAKRNSYVAYFSESTKGLRVGSNILMNGVQIGEVGNMALIVDQETLTSVTEVTIEVTPESWLITKSGVIVGEGLDATISHGDLVKGGLRASLQAESLVTGQLAVAIGFRPDTPAVLRGGPDTPYPEIPTVRSGIQEMIANIETFLSQLGKGIDAEELAKHISSTLSGIDELANSEDIRESLAGINTLVNEPETQELTATLQSTLKEVRSAAVDAGSLLRNADVLIEDDLKPVVERLAGALDEAQQALAAAKFQLRGDSVQVYQLGETLREVEGAARAMREFLDYLEQNPEALLKGKKQ